MDLLKPGRGQVAKIVLSYRREDSRTITSWLYEKLVDRYGKDAIFRDIDSIQPTENFRKRIGRALRDADFVVAVIGPGWTGPVSEGGEARIHSANDWVRVEIETALQLDIPLLPVLVEDAQMPQPESLPASLREITEINALPISSGSSRFYDDLDRLFRTIDVVTGAEAESDEVEAAAPPTVPEESPHLVNPPPPLAPFTSPPAEPAPIAFAPPPEPAPGAGATMPSSGRAGGAAPSASANTAGLSAAGAPQGLKDGRTLLIYLILPAAVMCAYWIWMVTAEPFHNEMIMFLIAAAGLVGLGLMMRRNAALRPIDAIIVGAVIGLVSTVTVVVTAGIPGQVGEISAILVGGGTGATFLGYALGMAIWKTSRPA